MNIIRGCKNETESVKLLYEFVRDEVKHSADIEGKITTCRATEVLRHKEGICYSKSHLLAAMLRCIKIPAGLCYQKLILDDVQNPYLVLHGINAVYLKEFNQWIRLDARGNKQGINAVFSVESERLAFPVRKDKNEEDIYVIFCEPDANVIKALSRFKDPIELYNNLPRELAYLD